MKIEKLIYSRDEARNYAIDWQEWVSKQSMTYGDMCFWYKKFIALGKTFKLTREFKENGII